MGNFSVEESDFWREIDSFEEQRGLIGMGGFDRVDE